MTLPVSGAISFNNINVELGVAGTTQASLGQSSYRTLAGVASGAISMSNFYGKSNRVSISYTFSANTANASLNLSTISGYAAGTSDITVTINSGVYLYSTSTGGYGLNLSGGTTGDTLTIVNNGFIIGQGGQGGGRATSIFNGESAGAALNFGFGMAGATVNNTNASAYIAGGGGGGGGTAGSGYVGGGGGAGGGYGAGDAAAAVGGGPGSAGADGTPGYGYRQSGAGGRILPGVGGAPSSNTGSVRDGGQGGGAGGGGGAFGFKANATGGTGGSGSSSGGVGSGQNAGGGGGGWGASGGAPISNAGGTIGTAGAGGKAVNLNGKSITWTSGNTTRVYGAVS